MCDEAYQGVFALHHVARKRLAVLVDQRKLAADLGPSDTLGSIGYPLPLHALLFMLEIPHQQSAGRDEEDAGLPREGLQQTQSAPIFPF